MDPSRIFRKVALERMSSPEQLDLLLQVTTPRTWMALAGLVLCVAGALAWGFLGELVTRVHAPGTIARVAGPAQAGFEARVVVSVADAAGLHAGLDAEVLPSGARREEHGVLLGTVSHVGDVAPDAGAPNGPGTPADPAGRGTSDGAGTGRRTVEVRIAFRAEAGGGYAWSTRGGSAFTLRDGLPCDAAIVTGRQRPIDLVVPRPAAARQR